MIVAGYKFRLHNDSYQTCQYIDGVSRWGYPVRWGYPGTPFDGGTPLGGGEVWGYNNRGPCARF